MLCLVLVSSFAVQVSAKDDKDKDKEDKIVWCHTEPNGNQQTLELPQQALENAGHVNASGNPLHAGDHAGPCILVDGTPTPTVTVTVTPSPTPEDDEKKVNICHITGSVNNPFEAIRVNESAFDGVGQNDHTQHGDFLYNGPVNPQNDQPLKPEGDEWCENPPTPTPSATPTPSTTTTNNGGTGGTSQSVAGATTEPTKAVLGLSATASSDGSNKELALLFSSFILLAVGAKLTLKKNA